MNSGRRKETKRVPIGKTRKLDHSLQKRIPELYSKLIHTSILAQSDEICSCDDKNVNRYCHEFFRNFVLATRTLILFMVSKS